MTQVSTDLSDISQAVLNIHSGSTNPSVDTNDCAVNGAGVDHILEGIDDKRNPEET